MVKSTLYKGIEFVRVSQLTKDEQEVFNKNSNRNTLIKILIDDEIVHDCIQYKDYVSWYQNSFSSSTKEKEVVKMKASSPVAETVEAR